MNWQSWWAPVQDRMDTQNFMQGMQRLRSAQNAPYGSLAQQWDPTNYGSQQRQWMPQFFDPAYAGATLASMQRRQQSPYYRG